MERGARMEAEIREQPDRLAEADYGPMLRDAVGGREYDLVLLAARGTSDHAALYARYLIEIHAGIPVSLAAPSVITRYDARVRYPRTLVVGLSQSGAAPDVSEVVETLGERGCHTLAITNTPDSRLSRAAGHTLLLNAGPETSIAATKTYTTSLLAMAWLARALGAALSDPVLPTDADVARAEEAAQEISGAVVRSSPVFALGRGYGFATAQECALKLMECALIPCKPYSSADFEHGPKALAGCGSAAISFEGPLSGLAAQGCEVCASPDLAHVPETDRPLFDALFAQWVALHTARARGLDPDRARFLSKVTETL